jgi:hypothetical protein
VCMGGESPISVNFVNKVKIGKSHKVTLKS